MALYLGCYRADGLLVFMCFKRITEMSVTDIFKIAIMVACLMSYRMPFVKDSGAQRLLNIKDHKSQQ